MRAVASPRLLVVTDRARAAGPLPEAVAAAVRGGADGVLIRDRDLAPRQRAALARGVAAAARAAGGIVIVHSDAALARAVRAEGVHVADRPGAAAAARAVVGPGGLVGASVHDAAGAARAVAEGADFLLFGNVWETASHPGLRGAGVAAWRAAAEAARTAAGRPVPVLAIGGATARRLAAAPGPLPGGVACTAALLGASDPERAAGRILAAMAGPRSGAARRGARRAHPRAMDERALVAAFLAGPARDAAGVLALGPGDDAAVLADGTALALDLTIAGVHYLPDAPPRAAGWKAAARALSDLAAAGAEPAGILVGLSLPAGTARVRARHLVAGAAAAARAVGARLLGGDTKETPGAETMAVTAVGRVEGPPALPRSGAAPGDGLFATGAFGGSGGGRHLRIRPRVAAGLALRRLGVASACIDVSDGLAEDLRRLAAASGVGAVLDAARVPVHADARGAADPLRAALSDGEDHELLFTVPPSREARLPRRLGGVAVRRVGRIVHADAGVLLAQGDGGLRRLTEAGWVHFRRSGP